MIELKCSCGAWLKIDPQAAGLSVEQLADFLDRFWEKQHVACRQQAGATASTDDAKGRFIESPGTGLRFKAMIGNQPIDVELQRVINQHLQCKVIAAGGRPTVIQFNRVAEEDKQRVRAYLDALPKEHLSFQDEPHGPAASSQVTER